VTRASARPLHTWSEGKGSAHIFRRTSAYAQEHVLTVTAPRMLRRNPEEVVRYLTAAADGLCKVLDEALADEREA
jgi:hypothetical protein